LVLSASIGSVWAQTPAPAATPPADAPAPAAASPGAEAPPAATTTAATDTAAPAPVAEATVAPAPVEAPAVEDETFPAAWFRMDSDLAGLQLWAGATHMLTDSVGIATDMYINAYPFLGEFDIGPSFVAGSFYVTPMLGLQVDWANHRAAALVPQFYLTGGPDPIYMELWLQNYAYTVFDKTGSSSTGGANYIYARLFVDYKVSKYFAVGPEIEMTYSLNSKMQTAEGDKLVSMPIGVNIMLPNYGKGNNFFIFGGYETVETANDARLAGRLTFVRNF
jgi:hypothetical protein